MKKITQILFLSCLKSTELIEKRHHFKLSLIEGAQLKLHTSRCKTCASYARQSELIEEGIANELSHTSPKWDTQQLIHNIMKKMDDYTHR